ncbi:chromosome 3 open reading frame 38 [Plakobranchus ocellatus]|uniref:Chromosome 3 open reading frame 38 n=1 Tax=Plakobranchus ocellatus TaxID=259542 RepID=A0AAV3XZ92_9GAST|nr:chromosome 3 open reading frame 38 [Plakobranchus ocellatus]
MLSKQEKENCGQILDLLPDEDIFALVRTSTEGVVSVCNRKEALKAILNFTDSLDEFFKRQKITKSILLKYIWNQEWGAPRDKNWQALRDHIIEQWGKLEGRGTKAKSTESREKDAVRPTKLPDKTVLTLTRKNYYRSTTFNYNSYVNNTVVNIHNHFPSPQADSVHNGMDMAFAMSFAKWYYSLLNSCNPDLAQAPGGFGPQHFWRDVKMQLRMKMRGEEIEETLFGDEAVAQKLLSFPVSDRLLFHPSDNVEGIKIKIGLLGQKVVIVCGLVHKHGVCVGSFCQSFGLISDPAANNAHKVRVTLLKMVENSMIEVMPSVKSDVDALAIERLTVSALE